MIFNPDLHWEYKVVDTWYRVDDKIFHRGDTLRRAVLEENNQDVLYDDKHEIICFIHSENAHTFTVGNDDAKWAERHDRIMHIKFLILMRYNVDKLYISNTVKKYNRNRDDSTQPIIWDDSFYCAPLNDLDVILGILETGIVPNSDKCLLLVKGII